MDKTAGYVILAYMGLWLIIFIYLIVVGVRIYSLKREVNLLKTLVEKQKEG